jgi:hypothetical protein
MQIWSTNSGWFQIFLYEGSHFCNIRDHRCLEVTGNKDVEGQKVLVAKRQDAANQRWKIVYLDKADKEQTKGLNKEYGMHIDRPFYLVSRLPMRRVVENVGANNVVLKRYVKGRSAQQFFFDQTSKTIRSQ